MRPAGVASIKEDNLFPDLQVSSIQMYEDIDNHIVSQQLPKETKAAAVVSAAYLDRELYKAAEELEEDPPT